MSITDHPDVHAFILHWGEMGSRWGVNRSVSQIHALLYVSDAPLTAEAIADALGLARSNVSTGLKELGGYGIVRRVHLAGDRRDHFTAETDLWEMVSRIVAERKKREIDPTVAELERLADRLSRDAAAPAHVRDRIVAMRDFMGEAAGWYEQVRALPPSTLAKLMKLGGRIARFLPRGARGADEDLTTDV